SAVQEDDIAAVATSGSYDDLLDKPYLFSGDYDDLSGKPSLGDASSLDVGTTAGTVAAGDDSRITGALQPGSIGTTVQGYDAATAKTDEAQTFTKPQRSSVTALTVSSGAIDWTLASSNDFSVTL